MKNIIIVLLVAAVLYVGFGYFASKPRELGATKFTTTVTNSSTTVGTSDTVVMTPNNYQMFMGTNMGTGTIFCTFYASSTTSTAGAALNTGVVFSGANTTSTNRSYTITDPNLLGKYMHCISDVSSIMSWLAY